MPRDPEKYLYDMLEASGLASTETENIFAPPVAMLPGPVGTDMSAGLAKLLDSQELSHVEAVHHWSFDPSVDTLGMHGAVTRFTRVELIGSEPHLRIADQVTCRF
jgi:hypothetical protein